MSWQWLRNNMKFAGFWDVPFWVRQPGTNVLKERWPSSAGNKMAATSCFKHWYLSATPHNVTSQKTSDSASTALWEPPENVMFHLEKITNQLQHPQCTGCRHKDSACRNCCNSVAHLSLPQKNSACRTQYTSLFNRQQRYKTMQSHPHLFCTCYTTL